MLKKVRKLAYCLDVFSKWRIHPVFSVTQLEPTPPLSQDPFQQPNLDCLPSAFVEVDTDFSKIFEVEQLLNRCIIKRSRGTESQYLVCWVGYKLEFDQ